MTTTRPKTHTAPAAQIQPRRFAMALCALALLGGALVYAGQLHAQTPGAAPAAPAVLSPEAPASAPAAASAPVPAPAVAATTPRYSASEVAQMFGYIDRNKDGSLSREEASGFRGVARHFDEADTNKDNALSREEFEAAMNKVK